MCNFLHIDYKKIKNEGYGYKLFTVISDGVLSNLNRINFLNTSIPLIFYKLKEGSEINWDNELIEYSKEDSGFCFFLNKKEALRVKKYWSKITHRQIICHKIEYSKGIGKHIETKMFCNKLINVALCRKFKILEKIS